MSIKLFSHIKLSSTTNYNIIQIFQYECPECGTKDNYLCLDPDGVCWCFNCNEELYFQEMIKCQNPDLCQKIFEVEIGKIRQKDDDALFFEELEQEYLKELELKYHKNNGEE